MNNTKRDIKNIEETYGDGVLALSKSVPQLDALVARSGDDLTVVSGEGHGEHILGVRSETTGGLTTAIMNL